MLRWPDADRPGMGGEVPRIRQAVQAARLHARGYRLPLALIALTCYF